MANRPFTTSCVVYRMLDNVVVDTVGPFDCNLLPVGGYVRREEVTAFWPPATAILVFDALTDVRDDPLIFPLEPWRQGGEADLIECPPASGTLFRVLWVMDSFKGSAEEYRSAICYRAGRDQPML